MHVSGGNLYIISIIKAVPQICIVTPLMNLKFEENIFKIKITEYARNPYQEKLLRNLNLVLGFSRTSAAAKFKLVIEHDCLQKH